MTSLKQTCSEYLIKFSENQSAPKLENRKTSPCSPCAPNLLHVLVSRIPGYHNLCSPDANDDDGGDHDDDVGGDEDDDVGVEDVLHLGCNSHSFVEGILG